MEKTRILNWMRLLLIFSVMFVVAHVSVMAGDYGYKGVVSVIIDFALCVIATLFIDTLYR